MFVEMNARFIHARNPEPGQAGNPFFFEVLPDDRGDPGTVPGQQCRLRFHERDLDGCETLPPSRMHGEGELHARCSSARDDDTKRPAIGTVILLELLHTSQQQSEWPRGYGVFPYARGVHPPGNRTDVDRKGIVGERRPAVVEVDLLDGWIEAGYPCPDEPDTRPGTQRS